MSARVVSPGRLSPERTPRVESTLSDIAGSAPTVSGGRDANLSTSAGSPSSDQQETLDSTPDEGDVNTSTATATLEQNEFLRPTPDQGQVVVTEVPRPEPVARTSGHVAASSETPLLADVEGIDARAQPGNSTARTKGASVWSAGFNWWWLELAGALVGTVVVGAIVGILSGYDNKPQPTLPFHITLSALAAGLITIAKASSLFAVTAAISQLKWLWYRERKKARPLADLDVFDGASRGPLGSFILMCQLRGLSIVYLGALIVIASMFLEFATQLSISTGVRTYFVESDTVSVSRMRNFNFSQFSGNFQDLAANPLDSAGPLGFYSSTGKPDLRPKCPSESCVWPVFSSLGVCSKCVSVKALAERSQRCTTDDWTKLECSFELDHQERFQIYFGYNGNGPGTHFNASAYFNGLGYKNEWAGISYPISSFLHFQHMISHVGENEFRIKLLEASECAAYACVKTYNISVVNGTSFPEIVSTWYNGSKPQPNSGSASFPLYLNPPNATNISDRSGPYIFSGYGRDNIAGFISSKFDGFMTVSNALNFATNGKGDPGWIYASGDVSKVLENVALAYTDAIQTGQPNREAVVGQRSLSEIYVRVHWLYLALPITVVVLSVLFLLFTMYATKSNNASIWKASNLVLLFHGLEGPTTLGDNYQLNDLREMNRLANENSATLEQDETQGWRLVASTTAIT